MTSLNVCRVTCMTPLLEPAKKSARNSSADCGSRCPETLHAEQLLRIGPAMLPPPAGARGQCGEVRRLVLVRVLGMDGLAGTQSQQAPGHAHRLRAAAQQVHLDAAMLRIVERAMA